MSAVVPSELVGARIRRKEDPRLITGSSTYVDDVRLPGTLQLVFVRSIYAHARINGIDVSKARSMPGVVARRHRQGSWRVFREFDRRTGARPGNPARRGTGDR